MTGNSLLFIQLALLILGLGALYLALSSNHLMKKILGWVLFQSDVLILWLSTLSFYHGQINPLPLVIVFAIFFASLGLLALLLILALGALKRHGSFEIASTSEGKS